MVLNVPTEAGKTHANIQPRYLDHTHTHTHSLSHTLTHTQLSLSHTHSHTHTALSVSHTHTSFFIHMHTQTCTQLKTHLCEQKQTPGETDLSLMYTVYMPTHTHTHTSLAWPDVPGKGTSGHYCQHSLNYAGMLAGPQIAHFKHRSVTVTWHRYCKQGLV